MWNERGENIKLNERHDALTHFLLKDHQLKKNGIVTNRMSNEQDESTDSEDEERQERQQG